MGFYIFALFFFVVLLLTVTFLALMNNSRIEKGLDLGNKAGLPVMFSLVLGWILLQASSSGNVFPSNIFLFGFYPFLIAAFSLSLYAVQKGIVRRFWIYLLVTLLSVVFLPENLLVFQGYLPLFFDRFATAILWALFINAYTSVDKVAGLTVVQTSALCLAFSLFPYIYINRGEAAPYSDTLTFYPMIIVAALIGFMMFKKRNPDLLLGKTGATPLGYLMGLFLILMTVKGYWMAAVVMPAYYYFEVIYSKINQFVHRKNPEPALFTFFISGVIRKNLNNRGVIPFLFLMMLGFALTGVMFGTSFQLSVILAACLFFYTLYRLIHWGIPRITYRSMFSDTKQAAVQVKDNIADSVKEAAQMLQKKK